MDMDIQFPDPGNDLDSRLEWMVAERSLALLVPLEENQQLGQQLRTSQAKLGGSPKHPTGGQLQLTDNHRQLIETDSQ